MVKPPNMHFLIGQISNNWTLGHPEFSPQNPEFSPCRACLVPRKVAIGALRLWPWFIQRSWSGGSLWLYDTLCLWLYHVFSNDLAMDSDRHLGKSWGNPWSHWLHVVHGGCRSAAQRPSCPSCFFRHEESLFHRHNLICSWMVYGCYWKLRK